MADKPAESAPPKSKKMLLIVVVLLVVLGVAGAGAFLFVSKQRAAAAEDAEQAPTAHADAKGPPTYLPLDNMVVNLADPGGEKVAQVGITLELVDAKATDQVKQYLPTIRSAVLLLISQRTAEELLQREGKEKLARAILREASRPFGAVEDEEEEEAGASSPPPSKKAKSTKKAKARVQSPVTGVLFSSFIVQ